MYRYITTLFLSLILTVVHAQKITDLKALSTRFKQYERSDFEVTTTGSFKNPHDSRQVTVDMVITSPSGKILRLPCYFSSSHGNENVWSARFLPQESGEYRYSFVLTANGKQRSKSASQTFKAEPSDKDGILHVGDYWTFRFDSGKPFRGIGENVGWEARNFEDKKWTYDYLLPTLSQNGANYFRTWMCVWNLPVAWKEVHNTDRYHHSTAHYHEEGARRMDELVAMSDSLGLHFMVSIDAHGAFIPDAEWKRNSHNKANGGPAATPQEFFTNSESRAMYKNRLRYMVARWGYSPAIGAWEFFNEIDNATFTPTPHDSVLIDHKIITEWHDEMSTYLKDVDPFDHIVTTSISHRDIKGMNDLPNLDLNQKHIYNKTHLIVPTIHEYIARHKKPYVIGEFGYDWNWDNVKHEYGSSFDFDYRRGLWYGLFSPTPILPMTWWWEYFDERKMTPYFKSVSTINRQMLEAGKGAFENVKVTAGSLEGYAVRCGSLYFVYLLNNANATHVSKVLIESGRSGSYKIESFNPYEHKFSGHSTVKVENGTIAFDPGLLNVHEERIFILSPEQKNAFNQSTKF
jgi:hypothetical protein